MSGWTKESTCSRNTRKLFLLCIIGAGCCSAHTVTKKALQEIWTQIYSLVCYQKFPYTEVHEKLTYVRHDKSTGKKLEILVSIPFIYSLISSTVPSTSPFTSHSAPAPTLCSEYTALLHAILPKYSLSSV